MINIEYGVVLQGAKEAFQPHLFNFSSISNVEDLSKSGLIFKNVTNPCDKYSTLLDGSSLPIPENTADENIGAWSSVANEKGEFEGKYPIVALISDELFTCDGLRLVFDDNAYPTRLSISWYEGDTELLSKEYDSESSVFSVLEYVENFNKIVIVFLSMNTPYSRLKLRVIDYGYFLEIDEGSVQNIKIHQEIDPISTTLPVSTLDLSFINKSNANFNLSARQSLKVKNNGVVVGQYFIEDAKQVNKKQWKINAKDYIGILENNEFEGGMYFIERAGNILESIFSKANIPFTISDSLENAIVMGYIPYTTCREALQQVLFAIGGYANTAYSEGVNIAKIDEDIAEDIEFDRILQGQAITINSDVTEIELFSHAYQHSQNEVVLYKADEEQENIRIIFNEPVHALEIENGTIIESGANYATISCTAQGVLKGKKYDHIVSSKRKINTSAKNVKSANKKTIRNATLISFLNVDSILNLCFNRIIKNTSVKSKVVESENPIVVGHKYEVETELLGRFSGVLTEQNFSLFGGKKVVKEMVIK